MTIGNTANRGRSVDRRQFVSGGALTVLAAANPAFAQDGKKKGKAKVGASDAKRISQAIAEFVAGFDLKQAPQPVIDRARAVFVDTMGVMIAGSGEEAAHLIQEMVKAEGSTPAVTVVGTALRASPQLAALANGVATHAMDYDVTYYRAQSIAALVPAILSVAETTKATPAEAVAAYIVGAEVASRIVRTDQDGPLFDGWHSTGMVGVLAVAAACAKLMKLPAKDIPNVMGIAVSLASGVTQNFGTMTKPLHCGNAARNGVMAAMLGHRGYSASPLAFEGRAGYFRTFARGIDVKLQSFDDLGKQFDLVTGRHRFKPYPCGGLTHTSIEAALELRKHVGKRLADIKSIHCFVTRNAARRAGTQFPATTEAAKFSVGFLVPYALVHGAPRIAAFTDKSLKDERIRALAKHVTASVDEDLSRTIKDDSPARIRITMADGQVFEQRKDYGSGSGKNPMSQAQLEEKYMDCATQTLSADTAKKILAVLNSIPARASFDDLWPLLRKA
jgi:2-methylcitrate dehydratase PrpD